MVNTSIKPHACCRFSCPIADCGLELANKYNIQPDEIEDILVKANKWMITALCDPAERKYKPQTVVDAQFSLPYAAAVTLVKKRASVPEFTDEAIKDPIVLKVAEKVRWEFEPEFEKLYPKVYPAEVILTARDGRKYTARVDHPKGDPENPVSDSELIDKFNLLASASVSKDKINQIIDTAMNLDKLTDINQLTGLLRI
ncbi:MAG: MmgE/PrpD family protein [Firmicutes bacterium]|nr:MmgE/PrpD family protein [Bacillota bacterium]